VGNSGEVRARELAHNDAKCPARYHGKVERKRGAEIGLDRRFVYFRHKAMRVTHYIGAKNDANYNDFLKDAKERCRRFDAGAPADQVFAKSLLYELH
jgi:hypothetical protein